MGNSDDFLKREYDLLEQSRNKSTFASETKKQEFAELIKSEIGPDIKKSIELRPRSLFR